MLYGKCLWLISIHTVHGCTRRIEAFRVNDGTIYFSSIVGRLLKLSTARESPLHGPSSYVNRMSWERAASCSARCHHIHNDNVIIRLLLKLLLLSPWIYIDKIPWFYHLSESSHAAVYAYVYFSVF